MNKNKENASPDNGLHEMINAGLSQQAGAIDDRMQARLRRARTAAVSANQRYQSVSWPARLWRSMSARSVISAPLAQASVAMLVAVFSISLALKPSYPVMDGVSDPVVQQGGVQAAGEIDVLMSNEDMDFLENLEVYEWLVAEYG